MADYYPVLKRAISSLPSSSGEARRAVYEKARAALLKQLQSYDPPLSPAEVTDQRLALEECIRRVESETAGAAFGLTTDQADATPTRTAAPPPPPPAPRRAEPAERSSSEPARAASPEPESDLPQRVTVKVPPPAFHQPAPAAERTPVEPGSEPKIEAGVSAFTRTLRQAESLGEASSTAVRSARDKIEVGVPEEESRPATKIEPDFGLAAGARAVREQPRPAPQPEAEPQVSEASPAARPVKPPARRKGGWSVPTVAGALILLIALAGGGFYAYRTFLATNEQAAVTPAATPDFSTIEPAPVEPPAQDAASDPSASDGLDPKILDRLPQEGVPAEPVAPDARTVQTEPVTPGAVDPGTPSAPSASETPLVAQGPEATSPPSNPDSAVTTEAPVAPADGAASGPQVVVAQRAILYEEPIPGSDGSRVEARVLWSFVNEPVLPGEAPTPQIRAQIEIPDRDIRVLMSIRKNTDAALPASHIVELRFQLPEAFAGRSIDTTPGLIMKPTEDARGDPLIGAVAKVADNLFWLALSGLDQDATRNIALMKEGEWIDIPIRYMNRRRAILTFEKGGGGAEVFRQAFQAWGQ